NKPRFFISYKDQVDLYSSFKEKLKELGIPPETVYNVDYDGTHEKMNRVEKLSELVCNHEEVPLCVRARDDYVN
ncbi:hypothetical protein Angca_000185, partial [Angiostrongylus cantonensis]